MSGREKESGGKRNPHDVIIIGAGPAGCFTAYRLAKRKVRGRPVRILMLEASKTLKRLKPCGGEADEALVEEMPELKDIVAGEVETYTGYYEGRKLTSEPRPEKGVIFTRSRSDDGLDHFLPKLLEEKKNVTILKGQRVDSIAIEDDRAKVTCKNGESYAAKLVIDASGAMTDLYQKVMGSFPDRKRRIMCSVIEFKVKGGDKRKVLEALGGDPQTTRMDGFKEDTVGCFWLIYYDRTDVVNIGCGFTMDHFPKDRVRDYLRFLGLKGWKEKDIHNWPIPTHIPSRLCTDRVLWIGDSVGMARSETGHGLADFLKASGPLADTCASALETGDFSKGSLESYQSSPEVRAIMERSAGTNRNVKRLKFLNRLVPKSMKARILRWWIPKAVRKGK
jgi:flavin-dependent dehydrogenase